MSLQNLTKSRTEGEHITTIAITLYTQAFQARDIISVLQNQIWNIFYLDLLPWWNCLAFGHGKLRAWQRLLSCAKLDDIISISLLVRLDLLCNITFVCVWGDRLLFMLNSGMWSYNRQHPRCRRYYIENIELSIVLDVSAILFHFIC